EYSVTRKYVDSLSKPIWPISVSKADSSHLFSV
ncbi:MAG: hypothetical protein ACJAY1_002104, partial [Glaciecola sp.]